MRTILLNEEMLHHIIKASADIAEQARREQCSAYMMSLIERLQDLIFLAQEDICRITR